MISLQSVHYAGGDLHVSLTSISACGAGILTGRFNRLASRPLQSGADVKCSSKPEDSQQYKKQERQYNRSLQDLLTGVLGENKIQHLPKTPRTVLFYQMCQDSLYSKLAIIASAVICVMPRA